jgi:cytosine/adenosine deaminase-related metal-dependent hydrolase
MATRNGARALSMERHYGTLSQGKRARFIYLDTGETHSSRILESIVDLRPGHRNEDAPVRWI